MSLSVDEIFAVQGDDADEVKRVFGYLLARCPHGLGWRIHDAEWAHPCDRDASGEYECEKVIDP